MTQDGFDFIGRKDYVFMNFHMEPMEALTVRAYQEDSRHAIQPLKQYVPLQWHFKIDNIMIDNERGSLCIRYGQNETAIALYVGALHKF